METIHILCAGVTTETEQQITATCRKRQIAAELWTTSDSTEAIDYLETEGESVDCVISSNTLADSSGIALLRTVRTSFPNLPFFLFVEELSNDLVADAIDAGVTDYLPNAGSESQVSRLVDRLLDVIAQIQTIDRADNLERINTVIRDLNRELVHASASDEIDQCVCDIFSNSDPYLFAWIGEHDADAQMVTGRAVAGVEAGYLDAITITTDEKPTAQGPTGKAVTTREMQVMQNILEDPTYEPWREQALERGYRSSAAIPLAYGESLYGVLNVYADRTDAFDADEQAILEELGTTIAYAHHEVEIHQQARRFQQAVEQAADAIFITDTDGTIEYANPAFEELSEYTVDEAIGRNPRILKSGEQPAQYYESMWETILEGGIWESEIINVTRSGEYYNAEQTIAPLRDESDAVDGFVAIQRDATERKERERELEQSKERLRLLFEEAPDGIIVHDVVGKILDVNETVSKNLGYTREELLSKNILDIDVSLDEDAIKAAWQSMEPGSMHRLEVEGRHRRKDGSTVPVEVWISKVRTEEVESDQFIAIVRDITERKERQRELERHEEIVESASDALWMFRDDFSETLFMNQPYEEIFGQPTSVLLDDPLAFIEAVHPDDRQLMRQNVDQISSGSSVDFELRVNPTENFERWVWFKGEPIYDDDGTQYAVAGFVRDITQLKDQQRELEVFERAIEQVDIGILITDSDGTIEYVNSQWVADTGYTGEEAIGQDPSILQSGKKSDTFYEGMWETILAGETWESEITNQRKTGELYLVSLTVSPVLDDDGGIDHFVRIEQDITDRRLRAQRLAVLNRILRHNLRNSMNVVHGLATKLAGELDNELQQQANTIQEQAEELIDLSEKTLTVYNLFDQDLEAERSVDIGALVSKLTAELGTEYPDADISVNSPDSISVKADERLAQALREAIENAIIYNDQPIPEVTIAVGSSGASGFEDWIEISIADNGPGIPEEERAIIETGEETPVFHGSGMGLLMIYWIVVRFGGEVTISENEPRGTIITLRIPA